MSKLRNHPYSQCYVNQYDNGEIVFVSYNTPIIYIKYENGVRFIECTGTYSATTRRQIGWFLKEYAPDLCYQQIKAIAYKGYIQM